MRFLPWLGAFLILFLLFLANLKLGTANLTWIDIFRLLTFQTPSEPHFSAIFWHFRLPKAATCLLAGAALAVSGLQMQTLFRNAMAGPDVLGLTSGASLAVSLYFLSPLALALAENLPASYWSTAIVAAVGSSLVFLIMLTLANSLDSPVALLIIGLMLSALTSSIVSILQFTSANEALRQFVVWSMGNLHGLATPQLQILAVLLVTSFTLSMATAKSLNAWQLGDLYARSLGVRPARTRMVVLLSAGLLTGSVTAFCGPLAFIGLAVPHLVKLTLKTTRHEILIPASCLAGAGFLLSCDMGTQLTGAGSVLPINAVTSLIGAPVVMYMILKNRNWLVE